VKANISYTIVILLIISLYTSCKKTSEDQIEVNGQHQSFLKSEKVLVVLGSSTAAGVGLEDKTKSWVGLMDSAYTKYEIVNLAIGRICTYHIRANGDSVPGKPHPDTAHNITKALTYHPNIIIINLPSNDVAYGLSVDEYFSNINRVINQANDVEFYVTTSQPRNYPDSADRKKLKKIKKLTKPMFGDHALNFWKGIANKDGSIKPIYDVGDGIHLNYAAHRIFFNRIDKKITKLK